MTERVVFDSKMFEIARQLAISTLEMFEQRKGHYNNTLNSHLRGKVGEIACETWLLRHDIDCSGLFHDLDRIAEADILIKGSPFDVKTWDERYWLQMGRCVAASQLSRLRAKANGVIWCVTPTKLEPDITIEIVGWNTIDEIERAPRRMTGPSGRRQVDNYQVDEHAIRPLGQLLDALSS